MRASMACIAVLAGAMGIAEDVAATPNNNPPLASQAYSATATSPLIQAASKGQSEMVRALLAQGAGVNEKDSKGWTPLTHAASGGHTETVQVLLSVGADVNAVDKKGYSVLMVTGVEPYDRRVEVAKLLIEKGADVNYRNENGLTALAVAAQGYSYSRKMFIDSGYKSVALVPTEFARVLIGSGADVNAKDKWGQTALITAAFNGQAETARLLIENGADVNAHDDVVGYTVLMNLIGGYASWMKRLSETEKKGLSKSEKLDSENFVKGFEVVPTEIADLLINAGADVNAQGKGGMTALIMAASSGMTEIVRLLIRRGADVNVATDDGGLKAFDFATANGHEKTARLLEKAGGGRALSPIHSLAARFRFKGFSILPPQNDNWNSASFDLDAKGITFFRRAHKKLHSIVATARISEHTDLISKSDAEFLQYVKEKAVDNDDVRFKPIDIRVSHECYQKKGCVKYDSVVEDHGAPSAAGTILIINATHYFFRHPDDPKYIVEIGYSQRFPKGDKPLPLEDEVKPFLQSIVFTPIK